MSGVDAIADPSVSIESEVLFLGYLCKKCTGEIPSKDFYIELIHGLIDQREKEEALEREYRERMWDIIPTYSGIYNGD